jgi:hypothetical protein
VLLGATALKGARLLARRPDAETVHTLATAAAAAAGSTAAMLRARRRLDALPLTVWAAYRAALAAVIVGGVCQDRSR